MRRETINLARIKDFYCSANDNNNYNFEIYSEKGDKKFFEFNNVNIKNKKIKLLNGAYILNLDEFDSITSIEIEFGIIGGTVELYTFNKYEDYENKKYNCFQLNKNNNKINFYGYKNNFFILENKYNKNVVLKNININYLNFSEGNEKLPQFNIELINENNDLGTIIGSGIYNLGTDVIIKANNNEKSKFIGWYNEKNELISNLKEYKIKVNENIKLIAKFMPFFTVKLINDNKNLGKIRGAGVFCSGSLVTVYAKSESSSIFCGWYDNNVLISKERKYKFIINKDIQLNARFINYDELFSDPRIWDLSDFLSYPEILPKIDDIKSLSKKAIDLKRKGEYDESIEQYNNIFSLCMELYGHIPGIYGLGLVKTLLSANYFIEAYKLTNIMYSCLIIKSNYKDLDINEHNYSQIIDNYKLIRLIIKSIVYDHNDNDLLYVLKLISGNQNYTLNRSKFCIYSELSDFAIEKKLFSSKLDIQYINKQISNDLRIYEY